MGFNRRTFLKHAVASAVPVSLMGQSLPAFSAPAASAAAPLKVGVVHVSAIGDYGWAKQHDLARQAVDAAFPGRAQTMAITNIFNPLDAERVFRDLAGQGHQLIFGTSFSHMTPIMKVAREFPNVRFEHCSGLHTLSNLSTFEARYYEGSYLAGIAAASVSKTKVIGFIGGFPIPDLIATANAFLLGARSVDPQIVCKVVWLNTWIDPSREREAAASLLASQVDVLLSTSGDITGVKVAEEKGVWSVGYASDFRKFAPKGQLTSFTLDWSGVYVDAARRVLDNNWVATDRWDGVQARIVKMAPYNPAIPAAGMERLRAYEARLAAGTVRPFTGPVKDTSGRQRLATGAVLADADIRKMDWYVEGILGAFTS